MDGMSPLSEKSNIPPARLRTLLTVATVVSQSLDPEEVAEVALWLAMEAMSLTMGMVLVSRQGQKQVILADEGVSDAWRVQFRQALQSGADNIIKQALAADHPLVVPDLLHEPPDELVQLLTQANVQALLTLPFQVPGSLPGLMIVGNNRPGSFKPADVEFLHIIAGQISTCLRNTWLFARSQRQLKDLKSVTEVAQAVVSTLDLDRLLTYIMEEVMTRLNTEAAALMLLDEVRQELEFSAVAGPDSAGLKGIRLPLGQGIVGWVAERDEPLFVPDVSKDPRFFKGLDKQTKTVSQAILCVPLRARDKLIGVVEVINKRRGKFTTADQRFLESLASFAAVAIENARFYEEATRQIDQATLYAKDLTAAYRRERRQRKALDHLRYSFLNVVGHELRSPISIILQSLEILQADAGSRLSADQLELLEILGAQSGLLKRLIDGLVTFATFSAKQGTMKFRDTPFAQVLDEALSLARFKAKPRQIIIEDRCPAVLPTLSLDKDRLVEAVNHLIDNAINVTTAGGKILVQTTATDGNIFLKVIDYGAGIPPDQLDSIWDSFVQMNTQLERGLEGLGLGLAITRYIVEAHSGEVSVKSGLGRGSAFTIRLPYKP